MKKFNAAWNFLMGSIVTFLLLSEFSFKKSETASSINKSPINQWYVPALPDKLSFAGENVPLNNWEVKERLDHEMLLNYYDPGVMIYLMKLANRNFPIISERLKTNGVPDDFKYVCIAESNMQSWAVSKSGAVGYWQFLDGTAPACGLETTSQVDQRQDLEKSTDAACRYFKEAYAEFGSWTAAAASYNCGMGGYGKQAATQHTKNYYDLQLPEETNKYIFRILAFKNLFENAKELGFDLSDSDKYPEVPFKKIVITSSIPDLAQYAINNGTTYRMLHVMNPWLKGKSLTITKGKMHTIKLPERRSF